MDFWLQDIHRLKVHEGQSTLDGKYGFGRGYPLCQYEHQSWFSYKGPEVQVKVTEDLGIVTCQLCLMDKSCQQ